MNEINYFKFIEEFEIKKCLNHDFCDVDDFCDFLFEYSSIDSIAFNSFVKGLVQSEVLSIVFH